LTKIFDICVIGGGSGGLSVAAGASQLGARTVLIERGRMGGDCLNFGCVPSKALLAVAKLAHAHHRYRDFGLAGPAPSVDFAAVMRHVKRVIEDIAPHDSVERFQALGVHVIKAEARFVAPDLVEAGGERIRARRFVIATGSSPVVPPVPGLKDTPYLTNETIFDLKDRPRHLAILGGGPIGLEMAQAFRRLGAEVSVFEMDRALAREDRELVEILLTQLRSEGISVFEGAKIENVQGGPGVVRPGVVRLGVRLGPGGPGRNATATNVISIVEGSHLLVAAGRRANVDSLGLDAAGVATGRNGIVVDAGLRTSNRKIYAVGDVAGLGQYTHLAGFHAGIVLRSALFRLPARADRTAIPGVVFTDPEFAHVGLRDYEARGQKTPINILRWPFAENDRAQAERDTRGLIKVITSKKGHILGASLVGRHAGEVIQPWILAIAKRLKIADMASLVVPYPTLGEVGKRAAGSYFTPKIFNSKTRKLVRFLARLG
jgi:pyruvate/2-oxoglutarate dehydrogenase complex dihydrolipoamide dehydrogenase (E3) component